MPGVDIVAFVPGWMTTRDLCFLHQRLISFSGGVFVEIGVALGCTTTTLAGRAYKKGTEYVCVDTFDGSDDEDDAINDFYRRDQGRRFRLAFEANCRAVGVWDIIRLIEESSVDAAAMFEPESIAMCFIDADHRYESVKQDIAAWWPKLVPNGWLTGHDWRWDSSSFPVQRAVKEFAVDNGLKIEIDESDDSSCWAVRKPL